MDKKRFGCPFCTERFNLLEKRNNHIVEMHDDLVNVRRDGKTWVYWQPIDRRTP